MEALAEIAKARSMPDLQRYSKQRQVNCALRVPLLMGVQSAEFGRALRKVLRVAVDAALPGDCVLVDFVVTSDSDLLVKAGSVAETGWTVPSCSRFLATDPREPASPRDDEPWVVRNLDIPDNLDYICDTRNGGDHGRNSSEV